MSKQVINVGNNPNDNSGDTIRAAMQKINANFTEVYANTDAGVVHPTDLSANLANYSNTAVLTALLPVSTVNNALYLNGLIASGYQTMAGFAANTAAYLPSYTGVLNASSIAVSGGVTIGADVAISGNLTVTGNLTLAGVTTFVNSTVITTTDKNIILSNGAATSLLTDGTGLIAATFANLVYKNLGTSWQSNVNVTPAANNLGLGNTTSVWNLYSNNIITNNIYPSSNNYSAGNTTSLWNLYSNNIWGVSANISGQVNTSNISISTSANIASVTVANSLGVFTTATVNSTSYTVGTAVVANSLGVFTTGTVNAASVNAASLTVGSIVVDNTTGISVSTNTLNLGTYTSAANGYTYLTNNIKMIWGWVSANNSTGGDITFNSSSFTTNAWSIQATPNTAGATYVPAVISWTKSGASIRTANATSINVFWQAIGY
jgi:hypothetical protein